MTRRIATLAIVVGLALPVAAENEKKPQRAATRPVDLKTTPDELPKGTKNFNGMLVGRLAKKDVEKGTFIVKVDAVPRVWRNSNAENPKSIVGKQAMLAGFWRRKEAYHDLAVGDTFEGALQHVQVRSDHLTVGEFRKIGTTSVAEQDKE